MVYALGEILLVVVGILIALWINNLNEERKLKDAQRDMLLSFVEDLKADAMTIDRHLMDMTEIMGVHNKLHQIRKGTLAFDELAQPGWLRRTIRYSSIVKTNNPDIGAQIKDPDIKKEVLQYYRGLAQVENSYEQYDDVVKEIIRPYLREKLVMNEDYLFEKGAPNGASPVDRQRFFEIAQEDEFGQNLFEANLKAEELINYFDGVLGANSSLQKTILERIDL